MNILQCLFMVIIFSANAMQYAAAQEKVLQRGQLIKTLREKRQAANITTHSDVPYIDDHEPSHMLDIYIPAKPDQPLPVLVHLHGGGWTMGDKRLMSDTGMFYASQGIMFIAPNYRLSPAVQHPAHVEDCAAALRWVIEHVTELGGDPNRIFLSGHSAGAHLAALLGTNAAYLQQYTLHPSRLAGVIPVDTASFNLLSGDHERLVKRFIQQAFGSDEKVLREASPLHNVTDQGMYPKFLILNTTNRASGVKEAQEFAERLRGAGCDARFLPVDDHTHSEMATGMHDASDPVGSAILTFILQKTNQR